MYNDAMNMAWRGLRAWGVLSIVVGVATCKDSDGTTGSGGGDGGVGEGTPVPLSELCDVVVEELCTSMVDCYGWDYRDVEHCEAEQWCWGMDLFQAAIDAGEVEYDPDLVGRCRALFEAEPCLYGFFITVPTVDEMLNACVYVMMEGMGTQPPGAACSTEVSCDRASVCEFDGACPGTCVALAGEGDACGDDPDGVRITCNFREGLICEEGTCRPGALEGLPCESDDECGTARCNLEVASVGVCDPGVGEGEACSGDSGQDCRFHLVCDRSANPEGAGVCRPYGDAGAACEGDFTCVEGLVCHDADETGFGTCGQPRSAGETCEDDDHCETGLFCRADAGTRSCASQVDAGEACGGGEECLEGLLCEGGVCIVKSYPGDPCGDAGHVCIYSRCDGDTCRTHLTIGEACSTASECISEQCTDDVCVDPTTCEA